MEISFVGVSSADAGRLARELSLALKRELSLALKNEVVPEDAIKITRSSPEHADLGTIIEALPHLLAHAGYIACFGKCMYDLLGKHPMTIRVTAKGGKTVEIPNNVDLDTVTAILQKLTKEAGT